MRGVKKFLAALAAAACLCACASAEAPAPQPRDGVEDLKPGDRSMIQAPSRSAPAQDASDVQERQI